jgi:hypothetical protein
LPHTTRPLIALAAATTALAALGTSCTFPDPPTTSGFVALTVLTRLDSAGSVLVDTADGARTVTIDAALDTIQAPVGVAVSFTTTAGTLLPTSQTGTVTVPVDAFGHARVQLRAPSDTSRSDIVATAAGITRSLSITWLPAPATVVQVQPPAPVLSTGSTHTLTLGVTLLRSVGTPSPGSVVFFKAVDTLGQTVGRFSADSLIATTPAVSVSYTAGDGTYLGPVTFRVRAARAGQSITGTGSVLITK